MNLARSPAVWMSGPFCVGLMVPTISNLMRERWMSRYQQIKTYRLTKAGGAGSRARQIPQTAGQTIYLCREGTWYEVILKPVPEESHGCFDAFLGRPVSEVSQTERVTVYGQNRYAVVCRAVHGKKVTTSGPSSRRQKPRPVRTTVGTTPV